MYVFISGGQTLQTRSSFEPLTFYVHLRTITTTISLLLYWLHWITKYWRRLKFLTFIIDDNKMLGSKSLVKSNFKFWLCLLLVSIVALEGFSIHQILRNNRHSCVFINTTRTEHWGTWFDVSKIRGNLMDQPHIDITMGGFKWAITN